MVLIDANVLLYAVNPRAPRHRTAHAWLDEALAGGETTGFAWVVLLAFLRLSTHPRIFPRPLSVADAVDVARQWLAQSSATVIHPGDRHLSLLHGLLADAGTAANLVNDAHLAALALEHGARIVSFDQDFARFEGVRWDRPGATSA